MTPFRIRHSHPRTPISFTPTHPTRADQCNPTLTPLTIGGSGPVPNTGFAPHFIPSAQHKGRGTWWVLSECLMSKWKTDAGASDRLGGTEGMSRCHRTLTDRGWCCPLSPVSTADCVSSSQHEPLSTAEAAVGVVLKSSRGRGASHASVDWTLQWLTRNG